MKYNFRIITGSALAVTLLATSCNKLSEFGDTNLNPAATTQPITAALFTNVLSQLGGFASNVQTGTYVQYFSEAEYPSLSLYAIPQTNFEATYSGPLYDLQNMININANPAEVAAARIVKAYIFSTLTDRWGDIPYFSALKGVVPTYDKQELIYKDLIKELTEASTQVESGGAIKGDIMYNGNVTQWKKLANSLRMILALNLSKRYPGPTEYAATEFRAALAGGGSIETNTDNFTIRYPGGAFQNPFYVTHLAVRDAGESATMVALLASLGDTRQNAFGSSSIGVPYGYTEGQINVWRGANPGWSRVLSDANRTESSPIAIVRAASVLFARAEAADRGWTTENAGTLQAQAVTASFAEWNVTMPGTYLTQPDVLVPSSSGTGANLKNIATQRWIATYPDGTAGWTIWRRTGYPVLVPSPNPVSAAHTTIPRRLTYGNSEYSLNPGGVGVAVASMGADLQETRVWWDL